MQRQTDKDTKCSTYRYYRRTSTHINIQPTNRHTHTHTLTNKHTHTHTHRPWQLCKFPRAHHVIMHGASHDWNHVNAQPPVLKSHEPGPISRLHCPPDHEGWCVLECSCTRYRLHHHHILIVILAVTTSTIRSAINQSIC